MNFFLYLFIVSAIFLAFKKWIKFSTAVLLLLLFSILSNVALAQNYTESLIPEANDGIGVSNRLAYFIIGEDRWSIELFKSAYNFSTAISIVLLLVYMITLITENVYKRKGIQTESEGIQKNRLRSIVNLHWIQSRF